jgi:hypothetical protein
MNVGTAPPPGLMPEDATLLTTFSALPFDAKYIKGSTSIGSGSSLNIPGAICVAGASYIPAIDGLGHTKVFSKSTGRETILASLALAQTIWNTVSTNLVTAETMTTDYTNTKFIITRIGFLVVSGTVITPPTITITGSIGSKAFTPINTTAGSISISPRIPVCISNGTGSVTFINTTASTGTFTAKLLVYGYFIGS